MTTIPLARPEGLHVQSVMTSRELGSSARNGTFGIGVARVERMINCSPRMGKTKQA
jgi:hypothetical protein